MTDDKDPYVNLVIRHIKELAYELQNDRNDGWVQEHYREQLKKIREEVNKALEK